MYTHVYKCLTKHGTTVHLEQADWDLTAPLGVQLPSMHDGAIKGSKIMRLPLDVTLYKGQRCGDDEPPMPIEASPIKVTHPQAHATKGGIEEGGITRPQADATKGGIEEGGINDDSTHDHTGARAILRINASKVFRSDGSARPADYILERIKALDGMTVEEAVKQRFSDAKGKLTKYKKRDLDYDIGKWLIVDIEAGDRQACSEAPLHCAAVQLLAAERPSMLAGMLDATSSDKDKAKVASHQCANTTLPPSAHALHAACHAPRPHRPDEAEVEMGRAFESALEGGTFDIKDMHFANSIIRQGFAAAMQTQGSDDKSDMGRLSSLLNAHAFMAMRDVKWHEYLSGPEHAAIIKAYHSEWNSLKDTGVLLELDASHPDFDTAVRRATSGRCLLEFKRVGIWKCRVVVRGCCEDRVYLDGAGFDYAANVCELASVRNMLFTPRNNPHGADAIGIAVGNSASERSTSSTSVFDGALESASERSISSTFAHVLSLGSRSPSSGMPSLRADARTLPEMCAYMLVHACRTTFVAAVMALFTSMMKSMIALATSMSPRPCMLPCASSVASPSSASDCAWKPKPPRAQAGADSVNLAPPLSTVPVSLASWLLAALFEETFASRLAFSRACLSRNCALRASKPSSPRSLRSSTSPSLP